MPDMDTLSDYAARKRRASTMSQGTFNRNQHPLFCMGFDSKPSAFVA